MRILRLIYDKICGWWRSLPQKKRVQIIASILLVFAGTEVVVLAPYIFDIALMIDVGGLVVVLAGLRSSVSVSMMQMRALVSAMLKPIFGIFRIGEMLSRLGSNIPSAWYQTYFLVDKVATVASAALVFLVIGISTAKLLSVSI